MQELENPFASEKPLETETPDMPVWLFRITVTTGVSSIALVVLAIGLALGAWAAFNAPMTGVPPEDVAMLRATLALASFASLGTAALGLATTAGLFARARWSGYGALIFALLAFSTLVLSPAGLVLLIGILHPTTQRSLDCRLTVWD